MKMGQICFEKLNVPNLRQTNRLIADETSWANKY